MFFIPETRDRTLEEVHEMFENKVPTHEFGVYVCRGVEAFAAEGVAKADVIAEKIEDSGKAEVEHKEHIGKQEV